MSLCFLFITESYICKVVAITGMFQENRRHKRLCQRASRLDVADLLEIAAMKGLRPRDVRADPESENESPGDEAEPAPAAAAASIGAAASGIITHRDAATASEAKPLAVEERAAASAAMSSAGPSAALECTA